MKKFVLSLTALALLAGVVSCERENVVPTPEPDPVPVYAEGIYHPVKKIATLNQNGATQQWTWVGNNLSEIVDADGQTISFSYSGDYITRVYSQQSDAEELRYTYSNGQFQTCEVYYNGGKAMTMALQHDATGKVNVADIDIEDSFLMSMMGGMFGKGSAVEQLLGSRAVRLIADMAGVVYRNGMPKLSVSNKTFSMQLVWSGDNVVQQVTGGTITFAISADDLAMLEQLGVIPEEYLSIAQLAIQFGGGSLPLQLTMADTTICTYDDHYNPLFCNWGQMFSPTNLSLNNVVSSASFNVVKLDVVIPMSGQTFNLLNQSDTASASYRYEYNANGYPSQVTGTDGTITYTYQ